MLAAAPERSCGVVACGGAGLTLGCAVNGRVMKRSAVAGEGVRVRLGCSTELSSKREGWESLACGMYSVADVSSRELAKWEPIPVAFSVEEMIH